MTRPLGSLWEGSSGDHIEAGTETNGGNQGAKASTNALFVVPFPAGDGGLHPLFECRAGLARLLELDGGIDLRFIVEEFEPQILTQGLESFRLGLVRNRRLPKRLAEDFELLRRWN